MIYIRTLIPDLKDLRFVGVLVENLAKLNDKRRQDESLVEVVFFHCCCATPNITRCKYQYHGLCGGTTVAPALC